MHRGIATLTAVLASGAGLGAPGCGRAQGVPDEQLGDLVLAPKQAEAPIDVARAAQDPAELGRALTRPHGAALAALGPHTVTLKTTNAVSERGAQVSALEDQTRIELGEGGAFHALYTNSADYGREAIFLAGTLYLRPRYQKWHARAPEAPGEPAALRDEYAGAVAAAWELLAPGVELTDRGTIEVAGRGARKIEVKRDPSPGEVPREPLAQRAWRETRTIEQVTGEVVLDAEHGVPLAVKLAGTVGFTRDGRRFSMQLGVEGAIADIGAAAAIAAPPPAEVVATPERLREVDERDLLLQGIAPALRRGGDGAAAPAATRAAPRSEAP